jgi:hypothetical protein
MEPNPYESPKEPGHADADQSGDEDALFFIVTSMAAGVAWAFAAAIVALALFSFAVAV